MLKNYIFLTLAFIVFVVSILFISTYERIDNLIFMFSLGVMFGAFILNAGLNKDDFKERKYKRIIREKNNEIKTQRILHYHAAQAADDFFKQLQAFKK